MSNRHTPRATLLIAAATLGSIAASSPVFAHTGHSTNGLWAGLSHPLLGVDHIFAMVTVGVLAAVLGRAIAVPSAFLGAMVIGGAAGIAGMPLPGGEAAIAVSVVALGAALIAGTALHPGAALGLVALAGAVHGHAHGLEAPQAAHPVVYVIGFVVATAVLHIAGVAIGLGARRRNPVRASMGTAVLGVGLGLLVGVI